MNRKNEAKRIHAVVSGRVQGVGFRYFVQRTAIALGLTGRVRNLGDGRVEVYAEGDEETLQLFIQALEKGPALSHVRSVDVQWSPAIGQYSDFNVTY